MKSCLLLLLTLTLCPLLAQEKCTFEGRITNAEGAAIPYCSIYLPDLKDGSMTNIDGEFALQLNCGSHEVIFQSLGYEQKKIKVSVGNSGPLNVTLKTVSYALDEVNIDPTSEDPAYNIIRKATAMAEFYKKQVDEYSCQLYIRNFYNVDNIPWIAEKLADEEDLKEMRTGDVNETLLEYSFKRPNVVKEKILAKKSGKLDTSKNSSNYINLNFYNLGGAGIVNPLSRSAFQVYKFEYQHTLFDGQNKVHKVEVIPKRRGNDLMKGFLYINDGSWSLNNVDVEFEQPFAYIKYNQQYAEVQPTVWFPINAKINVRAAAVGFKATVQYLATLSELKVKTNPSVDDQIKAALQLNVQSEVNDSAKAFSERRAKTSKTEAKIENLLSKEKLTNGEAIKLVQLIKKQERELDEDTTKSLEVGADRTTEYADSAFAENDSLWANEREVPLSELETKIYNSRDSLNKIERGDTVINEKRSTLGNLLNFSGRLNTKNKNLIFKPYGILIGLDGQFNTVDGFTIRKELFELGRNNFKGNYFYVKPTLEYAFARETWTGDLEYKWQYNKEKRASFNGLLGRRTTDFNGQNALSDDLNSISTLLFADNFQKLYQEDFFNLHHQIDIRNGLQFKLGVDYAQRIGLRNYSDYTLLDQNKGDYTPNLPIHDDIAANSDLLKDHNSLNLISSISYTPKQYYRMKRDDKIMLRSNYPTFTLQSTTGINGVFESESNFQLLEFSISQSRRFRLIDEISYAVSAGSFLNASNLFFADYKSFATNPFYVLGKEKNSFKLLNYYEFNSSDQFLEAHFSVEDNFLLLKRLPLLNRTEITEKLEFNYLRTERATNYYEFGYSLNKIFLVLDAGIYVSFEDNEYQSIGFRLGLDLGD